MQDEYDKWIESQIDASSDAYIPFEEVTDTIPPKLPSKFIETRDRYMELIQLGTDIDVKELERNLQRYDYDMEILQEEMEHAIKGLVPAVLGRYIRLWTK